ncbi:MAG: TIGR00159 family protein [Candidatus Reconcilbacillus cellulovorans]|uniref:Diadenylate cyclase n=1 Tax=Candidatus Reconcilbacillus cellulovorans TaxID=1906605 RepID=A0A2A6DW85_9BACL|nr:MAG: TIGR00159 family protein [Candidatus Reconcilbacillus cellulovorans]
MIRLEWLDLTVRVQDIVDIAIVSYVIYKLIMLVRGTRAVLLLRGILVVLVVWLLSSWLELNTLKWMMDQMITFGVLGLIIIFQPELRRALEQLGRGKLFPRPGEESGIVRRLEDVVRAVRHLADRRIGALIVFERRTGLNDYIESGVVLDALVGSELLIHLFIPNTPLHDGAVIVRGDRVMAARCYLPLSENPFISRELGTRHRAAIGVTEVSDAVAVAVSEETGLVSLAMNGQIVRGIDEESLIAGLYEALRPPVKSRKRRPWRLLRGRKNGDG